MMKKEQLEDMLRFSLSIKFNGKESSHNCDSVSDTWRILDDHFKKIDKYNIDIPSVISVFKINTVAMELLISVEQWHQCFGGLYGYYNFNKSFFGKPTIEIITNNNSTEHINRNLDDFMRGCRYEKYWGGHYLTNAEQK